MKALNYIALSLVNALFGTGSVLSRIIYAVVGVCGLYALSFFARIDTPHRD